MSDELVEKRASDAEPTSNVPVLSAQQHEHALHLEAQPLSKKARLSDIITVCAAGAALICAWTRAGVLL